LEGLDYWKDYFASVNSKEKHLEIQEITYQKDLISSRTSSARSSKILTSENLAPKRLRSSSENLIDKANLNLQKSIDRVQEDPQIPKTIVSLDIPLKSKRGPKKISVRYKPWDENHKVVSSKPKSQRRKKPSSGLLEEEEDLKPLPKRVRRNTSAKKT